MPIIIKARAKINLTLHVLGKRTDGYHDLEMVMQSVKLHDTLSIKKTAQPGVQLICDADDIPTDANNLIYKAAEYLINRYRLPHGVSITVEKRIPVSAGLGGGSSDCAATIKGLNELFKLNIPLEELLKIGGLFGSDVPFCIMQGTALAEGVGEKLTVLPPHPPVWILIACSDIYVSTAEIFKSWTKTETKNKDSIDLINALKEQNIQKIAAYFTNDLLTVTTKKYPAIASLIHYMNALNALGASMSGSGPTVFGYFKEHRTAQYAYEQLPRVYPQLRAIYLTEVYNV